MTRERTPRPERTPRIERRAHPTLVARKGPPPRRLTSIPGSAASVDDVQRRGRPVPIAIAAPDAAAQAALDAAARSLGFELVATGSGPSALDRARAALRRPTPPAIVVHGAAGAEALVATAATLSPRPVLVMVGAGSLDVAAARAASLDVELAMVAPYALDRVAPVLLAAARLAFERGELAAARATELLLRRRLQLLVDSDEHSGLHTVELVRRVTELELRRGKRYGYPLAMLAVGLDGVAPGDGVGRILKVRAAAALVAAIRDIDLGCELEGGDFLVLLPHTDRAASSRVAQRLLRAVAGMAPVSVGGAVHRIRALAGVTSSTRGASTFDHLHDEALAALGRARASGPELVVAP